MDTAFEGEKFAVIGESRGSYHAMGLAHTRPNDILGMMLIVADAMPGTSANWRPQHQTLVEIPEEWVASASPEARARFSRLVVQRPDIHEKIENTKVSASTLVDPHLAERLRDNFNLSFEWTYTITAIVPLPASALMLVGALGGLGLLRRRGAIASING